ncbi:MAG: RidA family protein [Cardiobacteriaceae bacterium]|nr:RidA family protein [Cardiobacteriaceae bacterium]
MTKQVIHTDKAPAAIGPYSQAVRTGNLVFFSGQIPLIPETMEMEHDFTAQVERVFTNLQAVCEAAGGNFSNIVKINIFLIDMSRFAEVNEIMKRYFTAPFPARAAIAVRELPREAQIEIEAVMAL